MANENLKPDKIRVTVAETTTRVYQVDRQWLIDHDYPGDLGTLTDAMVNADNHEPDESERFLLDLYRAETEKDGVDVVQFNVHDRDFYLDYSDEIAPTPAAVPDMYQD